MAEKLVKNVALGMVDGGTEPSHWSGALIDPENQVIWTCEHLHDNDIDAEFCSLDELLATPDRQETLDLSYEDFEQFEDDED